MPCSFKQNYITFSLKIVTPNTIGSSVRFTVYTACGLNKVVLCQRYLLCIILFIFWGVIYMTMDHQETMVVATTEQVCVTDTHSLATRCR